MSLLAQGRSMKDKNQIVIKNDEVIDIEIVRSKSAQEAIANLDEVQDSLFDYARKHNSAYSVRDVLDSEIYGAIQAARERIAKTDIGGMIARILKKDNMQRKL